jgi:hypothetical protein
MQWLVRPLPAAGWRRGLTTRHRSRGVIRAGFPALCPRTPNNEKPLFRGRTRLYSALSAPQRSCRSLPFGASASVVSDRLRLRGRILGAAFPHCSTMTRPQRSFAHLPDEQFDDLLRWMNLYRRQALMRLEAKAYVAGTVSSVNIREQYSAFLSNPYQAPVKKRNNRMCL